MTNATEQGGGDTGSTAGVGPIWRRKYAPNAGKHRERQHGRTGREPANGQDALDHSVAVKRTSAVRVGIDYEDRSIVVLRYHSLGEFHGAMNYEIFHGYVVAWDDLKQEQRNALLHARMANLRGKIL